MARLNVDDRWWSDPRRGKLIDLMGSRRLADGFMLEVWRLGQEYEPKGKSIPLVLFDEKELEILIKCHLAIRTTHGIYIKGSRKRTAFLNSFEMSERGKASARSRKKKYGTAQPKGGRGYKEPDKSNISENNGAPTERLFDLTEPSSSSSSSSSSSKKERHTERPADEVSSKPFVHEFISVYVRSFQKRYGSKARPDLNGKIIGQINRVLKDIGLARASLLIQVYFQVEDPWFITKCHDFATFVNNLQKISIAYDTGSQNPSLKKNKTLRQVADEAKSLELQK